jgi:protein-S-isoprenylcysteine O-methyltransferase Ste14
MKPCIPPPLLMLLAAALMWSMHRWWPLASLLSSPWNRIALLPTVAGILIAAAAITQFRRSQTTLNPIEPSRASHLVTAGIFGLTRNPMYLGLLLLLIGWALWLGSASPWFVPPLFAILIYAAQIAPEERALEALFGEAYGAYRQKVGRWIGRR